MTFVLSDIGGAVSVMNLIDKISQEGYVRENLGKFGGEGGELPEGFFLDDDDDEDEEYLDDDDENEEEEEVILTEEEDDLLSDFEWNDVDDIVEQQL